MPELAGTMAVSQGPPGTITLTVMPAPSNSLACPAAIASRPALAGPYGWNLPRSMVKKLVVTVTMRPQPFRFMPGTAARVRYQAPRN